MSFSLPNDWNSRRKKVYNRDNYTCQNCGAEGGEAGDSKIHAHHIVPKSDGGSHQLSNLQTLCKDCHNAIHHNDVKAPTGSKSAEDAEMQVEFISKFEDLYSKHRKQVVTIADLTAKIVGSLGDMDEEQFLLYMKDKGKLESEIKHGYEIIQELESLSPSKKYAETYNYFNQYLSLISGFIFEVEDLSNTLDREIGDSLGEENISSESHKTKDINIDSIEKSLLKVSDFVDSFSQDLAEVIEEMKESMGADFQNIQNNYDLQSH